MRELELLLLPLGCGIGCGCGCGSGGGWVGPMGDAGHVGADGPTEAQVEQMFLALDADGSGLLERGEIAGLAQDLGQDMSEEDLDDAMAEMDEDDSGGVELAEFLLLPKLLIWMLLDYQ